MGDVRWLAVLLSFVAACGDDASEATGASSSSAPGAGGSAGAGGVGGGPTTGSGATGGGGAAAGGAGGHLVETAVITSEHRFIDGQMFGGWGPHLGHLVRAGAAADGDLYFVDDACSQPGSGGTLATCDVNDDHTLAYHRRDPDGWVRIATATLPGTVQQNTATIVSADGSTLHTFGIDVAGHFLIDCSFPLPAGPAACNALSFDLDAFANYVGAAVTPDGFRMAWWTVVADGGGGSFHYVVDYGGGWNGPRSGPVTGGYNDASYVNIGFPTDDPARFVMHGQLVSGLAPNWSFWGAIGEGDLTTTNAVTWALPLAAVNGDDPVASTNDIWIDPTTQDEHVLARTTGGRLSYYHRAAGGSWSPALFVMDATFRARFVAHLDRLALVAGPGGGGLTVRVATAADRPPGVPIDWATIAEESIALPPDYSDVFAIYPASPPYQRSASDVIDLAIVGAERQNEVLSVSLAPR